MGYLRDVERSKFFSELNKEQRHEYLSITRAKYLPTIDNIYYSVFLQNDSNENEKLTPLLDELEFLKSKVIEEHETTPFKYGLVVDIKSYKFYKYCLSEPDLYDIFIINYLPNPDTPRILVQLRALGLWTHGAEKMLTNSYIHVLKILSQSGCKVSKCRENRIDYCYHTNIISNPEKTFKDIKVQNQMKTSMEKWQQAGNIEKMEEGVILHKDYFALGTRTSNNVFIRMYNKTREVIEQGYKNFFFEIWYQNGLISFYDKYCLEYALPSKNYDYIHKGRMLFYLEYGSNEETKQEFEKALRDKNKTLKEFKNLADKYLPDVTTVMNIEFETKRKFYYYSDKYIAHFDTLEHKKVPKPLTWIYKIIDNRALFLDYLTSSMLCFCKKKENPEDDDIYVSWWERLRNTKLDGIKADEKLLRDYTQEMDERIIKVRLINSVASAAVYNDNVKSDFIEDISDVLSNLNDNHAHKINVSMYGNDGEILSVLDSELLKYYDVKKEQKEMQLKNRKRHREEKQPETVKK